MVCETRFRTKKGLLTVQKKYQPKKDLFKTKCLCVGGELVTFQSRSKKASAPCPISQRASPVPTSAAARSLASTLGSVGIQTLEKESGPPRGRSNEASAASSSQRPWSGGGGGEEEEEEEEAEAVASRIRSSASSVVTASLAATLRSRPSMSHETA